jgi:hypothetical protein
MYMLPDIHDCDLFIERLARGGDGEPWADPGELGAYLVTATTSGSACYWVEPGLEAMVELFEEPRTCHEVAALICDATGAPAIELGVFEALVRAEILVPP